MLGILNCRAGYDLIGQGFGRMTLIVIGVFAFVTAIARLFRVYGFGLLLLIAGWAFVRGMRHGRS